jgi:hypothetical protein
MPLYWEEFDKEAERKAPGSEKLGEPERRGIEQLAAEALGVPQAVRTEGWGAVLGYGRDAQAVIQVFDWVEHRHGDCRSSLIVKIYRCRKPVFSRWHGEQFGRMPGFPGNPRVQQSVAAGEVRDWRGKIRSYAVLQYVPGIVLDARLETAPKTRTPVRNLLEQIFMDMVIPLWSLGHRGWDLRSGNLVVDPENRQLTMIDTDSYQNTFTEVTGGTLGWSKRDDFENRFFRRGVGRLVSRIGLGKQKATTRKNSEIRIARVLETSGFQAALHGLGRPDSPPNHTAIARQSFDHFLDRLADADLIYKNAAR